VLPDACGHRRRRCGGRSWRCGGRSWRCERRDACGRGGRRRCGRSRHQRLVVVVAAVAAQRVLEAAHALAERTPDLRQSLGAKDQQNDDQQQKDVKGILKTHARTIAQRRRCEWHCCSGGIAARARAARDTWRMATQLEIAELLEPLRADPPAGAVLFDIDGTLAPIVRHASDATVPEQTRTRLIELAKRYGTVACVSGRSAAVARQMVAIGSIAYIGNHGSELLAPGSREAIVDPQVARWAGRVREFADRADTPALQQLRLRREDKGAIVAFHWRGAPDESAAQVAVAALELAALDAGLETHRGRKVLEIRPPVPIDKGRGIRSLLARAPARGRALRRRRQHRRGRLRRPARRRRRGRGVRRRALGGDSAGARGGGRRDGRRSARRPRAARGCCCADAVRRFRQDHRAAVRRSGDGARRRSR
jgi:trehalose 6-phosphate phosphatase